MITVLVVLASFLLLVMSAAIVFSIIEFRREVRVLNESLMRVENIILPSVEKAAGTIDGVKQTVEKVNSIAGDVKKISGAVRNLAGEIEKITYALSVTTLRARASAEGFKAGTWAALKFLKANFFLRKGGSDNE
ncbi:MAG: hypothetical protein M0Z58_05505 [Nitrospiraceae bacterium]|nr:hypothetical protein [Nitrospiraceae bacterium]